MTEAKKTVDYGDDVALPVPDNILAKIDFLANEVLDADIEVETAEEALRKAKERRRDLVERQLPETMNIARAKELTTASNVKVKLADKVRASPSEAQRTAAFAYLRANGHGALIKTALEIPFEAGRDTAAIELRTLLTTIAKSDELQDVMKRELGRQGITNEHVGAAFAFLRAIGNNAEERVLLESTVHSQSLAALVRELLKTGKIDTKGMETLGAHAWVEADVKRKS